MNDERIEHDVHDALLQDDPGPLPAGLRARVAAIPEEVPLVRGLAHFRGSRLLATAAAIAAVAVVGAAIVIGVGVHNATIGPAASGSALSSGEPSLTSSPVPLGSHWAQVPATGDLAGATLSGVVAFHGGFIALGSTTSPVEGHLFTSSDGMHWIRQTPLTVDGQPAGIAALAVGGPGLVGVGSRGSNPCDPTGVAFVSDDGVSWRTADLPTPVSGQPFAASKIVGGPPGYLALGNYAACAGGAGPTTENPVPLNTPLLWHSFDGLHWTSVTLPESDVNIDALSTGGPGFILAGARHANGRLDAAIWASRDGLTWTPADTLPDSAGGPNDPMEVDELAVGSDRILAVSGRVGYEPQGRVWSSQDGMHWQKVADLGTSDPRVLALAWTPVGFVVAGLSGNSPGHESLVIRASEDGASWSTLDSLAPAQLLPAAIAASGNRIVVVGRDDSLGALVLLSTGSGSSPAPPASAPSAPPPVSESDAAR